MITYNHEQINFPKLFVQSGGLMTPVDNISFYFRNVTNVQALAKIKLNSKKVAKIEKNINLKKSVKKSGKYFGLLR